MEQSRLLRRRACFGHTLKAKSNDTPRLARTWGRMFFYKKHLMYVKQPYYKMILQRRLYYKKVLGPEHYYHLDTAGEEHADGVLRYHRRREQLGGETVPCVGSKGGDRDVEEDRTGRPTDVEASRRQWYMDLEVGTPVEVGSSNLLPVRMC